MALNSQGGHGIAVELYVLGRSLLDAGRMRSAALQFRKALGLEPELVDAGLGLGHCLHLLGEHAEALALYERLLETFPGSAALWNNRGTLLLDLGKFPEAAESFSRALVVDPLLHDARVALATCHQALGQVDQALATCEMVLANAPEHAEAHWNRGLLLLLKGEYREGWREYEWRWRKRGFTSPVRNFSQPMWRGEPAAGKTILIHAEQGFGDTLQFCRYVPLVAQRGMRVILECHPPLAPLMEVLSGVSEVVPMGAPLPDFDLHLPLLSLPLMFDTTLANVPAIIPYLAAPDNRRPIFSDVFRENQGLRVGICWAGKGYPDPRRSCPVELLAPLAEISGPEWYSLQVGWQGPLPFPMHDLTGRINDFADTAALMARLDLVISIDSAVAHLAGALAVPTWTLLPHAPDWRWLLEREGSPWYPSMKLFRQSASGDWQGVVDRLVGVLPAEVFRRR